jgi:hypothetical protein
MLTSKSEEKIVASKKSRQKSRQSVVMASKGGLARAKALSKEERSAIARKAADDRWAAVRNIPKETHSGTLRLGKGIPCSVLDNGKRVFSVMGLLRAFGAGGKSRATLAEGATPAPEFLSAANLQSHISPELRSKLENTIEFRSMHGGRALGYAADILNLICDALLDARAAGVLRPNQLRVAAAGEALMRALSKVGIIALIDEATGYQADRASDELQRLVEAYVVEDMRPWVGLFPDSFFKQIYRIHGWQYQPGVTQGPRYVGKFINKYVYDRLPSQVVAKLRALNPVIGKRRKHKHHQFLSEDIGEPTVDRHLASVTTLMSVANDKRHFDDMFRRAFPKVSDRTVLAIMDPAPLAIVSGIDEPDDVAEMAAGSAQESVGGVELVVGVPRISEKVLMAPERRDVVRRPGARGLRRAGQGQHGQQTPSAPRTHGGGGADPVGRRPDVVHRLICSGVMYLPPEPSSAGSSRGSCTSGRRAVPRRDPAVSLRARWDRRLAAPTGDRIAGSGTPRA